MPFVPAILIKITFLFLLPTHLLICSKYCSGAAAKRGPAPKPGWTGFSDAKIPRTQPPRTFAPLLHPVCPRKGGKAHRLNTPKKVRKEANNLCCCCSGAAAHCLSTPKLGRKGRIHASSPPQPQLATLTALLLPVYLSKHSKITYFKLFFERKKQSSRKQQNHHCCCCCSKSATKNWLARLAPYPCQHAHGPDSPPFPCPAPPNCAATSIETQNARVSPFVSQSALFFRVSNAYS